MSGLITERASWKNVRIELGKVNEELAEYKIKSGLKKDDYIAWPMDGLYEGVEAVKNESEVDYDAPILYKDQQDSTEAVHRGQCRAGR